MSGGDGRQQLALGGLIATAIVLAGVFVFLVTGPSEPRLLGEQNRKAHEAYRARHVAECNPTKLAAIRDAAKSQAERQRCADDAQREQAEQATRYNDATLRASEEAARQAFYQARSNALQSALGVMVLGASVWAAWAASRAALYAKDAAEHTEAGAKQAKRSADAAVDQLTAIKTAERGYLAVGTPLHIMSNGAGRIYLLNSGRTRCHAMEMRFIVRTKLPAKADLARLSLARKVIDYTIVSGLPPKDQVPWIEIPAPIPANAQHILGYVRYRDVYLAQYRCYFRFDRNAGWAASGGERWNRDELEEEKQPHDASPNPVT